jgi:hypothetical protein
VRPQAKGRGYVFPCDPNEEPRVHCESPELLEYCARECDKEDSCHAFQVIPGRGDCVIFTGGTACAESKLKTQDWWWHVYLRKDAVENAHLRLTDAVVSEQGSRFRALPKQSCDPATKAIEWYSYDSRTAAEGACRAEGCERLGTKEEQIEYGSLCAVLWSSDAKGYFMVGKHQGCGNDGWNNGGWTPTAGAFCAGCPDCPAPTTTTSEDESGTPTGESTPPSDGANGASCSADEECDSSHCLGGICCRNDVAARNCNVCKADGPPGGCAECLEGFSWIAGEGCRSDTCSTDEDCPDGVHCRGGRCCSKASVWDADIYNIDNCEQCDEDGWCGTCIDGFEFIEGEGCKSKSCSTDEDCPDGVHCRGGTCCSRASVWDAEIYNIDHCEQCNEDGWCGTCIDGFEWIAGEGCKRTEPTDNILGERMDPDEPMVGIFGFASKYETFTRSGSNCQEGRGLGKGFDFHGHRLLCEDFEATQLLFEATHLEPAA